MFKALADPTRRSLLDELFREDGQTLHQLEARFAMTRFGVMKHLKVLEDAGLVVTRRQGREKLHHLNPVPIRLVHDRWVSKYAEPWAAGLSGLKQELERDMEPKTMEKVFEIYIKAHARATVGARSPIRRSGPSTTSAPARAPTGRSARTSTLQAGSTSSSARARCSRSIPPRRLVHTMLAHFSPEAEAEGFSRVTWEIEPVGDSCHLTARARPDAGRRVRADLRWLADDPLGPEDLARERRAAHHPRLAHVLLAARGGPPCPTTTPTEPPNPRYVEPGWFTNHVFNPSVALLTRAGISVWGSRASCACAVARAASGAPRR